MQQNLSCLVRLTTLALLFACYSLAQAEEKKVDPTGTWKWSITTPNGQTRESVLKLKYEGDKLTGTMSGRNREVPIEEAKIKGDELSFQITREFNGNKFTSKYSGKIMGDTIKGKMEFTRGDDTRTREWEAKRETAKSEPAS